MEKLNEIEEEKEEYHEKWIMLQEIKEQKERVKLCVGEC